MGKPQGEVNHSPPSAGAVGDGNKDQSYVWCIGGQSEFENEDTTAPSVFEEKGFLVDVRESSTRGTRKDPD